MRIQRLELNITRAELGINSRLGDLDINVPNPSITMDKEISRPNINHEAPSFTGDWDRVYSEMGLESVGEFVNRFRDAGRQAAMQGIAGYARQGDHFANHNIPARNRVPTFASSEAMQRLSRPQGNIALMPRSGVNLTWDTGGVDVTWSNPRLDINAVGVENPQIRLNPSQHVSTYLLTQPNITTRVVDALA